MIEYWTELYRHPAEHWFELLMLLLAFGIGTLISEYVIYRLEKGRK